MEQEKFTQALYEYLLTKNIKPMNNEPKTLYYQLQKITSSQRRGIWEFIANKLGVQQSQSHNYYHNTWCTQFYDDISPYRQVITNMVKLTPFKESSQLVQQFIDKYLGKNFSRHTIQQIVNIQKSRIQKKIVPKCKTLKELKEPSIQNCDMDVDVHFSDAVK
ncbi:Conserved_hypothetical protein [Hexamita inflata]|uniref:Uncharacterized protein n=1 Tax=Hexamita inflata TaxID=28002 RepID=A0AA86RBR4_9EUKA|nr:Conserved hypothetical protein [Hexamita inflata]